MIFAFQGNMREGKTLGMTAEGILLAYLTGETPIWANYHIFGYDKFTYFTEWKHLEGVKNAIILFDEIGTAFDARNYKSQDQLIFTHLFAQLGKLGNTLMYSAQRDFQVEKRIREQTDYVIECTRNWQSGIMSQTWYNTQRGREYAKYINTFFIDHPEYIYPWYNTYEVVESKISFAQIGSYKVSRNYTGKKYE